MKKTLLLGTCFALALMVSPAKAIDSTGGCGLGSMAWRGQSGIIPQVAAMLTNSTFLNTIGVTLGTSGCDPNGRVTGGTGKLVLAFIENNMEQFAFDASVGQGETLVTVAGILNVDEAELSAKIHDNFGTLFASNDVDAVDLTLSIISIAKA